MHGLVIIFWIFITLSAGCLLADFIYPFILDIIGRIQIEMVVQYIVKVGTEETTTGQYFLYCDDISKHFRFATPLWISEHIDDVRYGIDARKESLSETWLDLDENGRFVAWDCNFCGDYCPIDKWSVSIAVIAVELFGKSTNYLYEYGKKNNITWHKQARTSKSLTLAFISAIRASREYSKPSIITIEPNFEVEPPVEGKPVESEKTVVEEEPIYPMERAEFVMNDHIDYLFLNTLHEKFGGKCKITIIIERR